MTSQENLDAALARIREFRLTRDWDRHHTPRNLAAALAVEVAELQELFLWTRDDEQDRRAAAQRAAIEEELADVLIYALNLADILHMDPLSIVAAKLDKNERRYPPAKST